MLQILTILLNVVGPVFLVAMVGYLWARRGHPLDAGFVALIVNTISTPCLIIDTLTHAGLQLSALGVMAGASAMSLLLCLLAGWGLLRVTGQPVTTFLPALTWSNGGNIGLPMSLFAFGQPGLSYAIAYFTVSSLSNYTIGQGIAARGMKAREVLRMPIVYAIALALFLVATGLQLPTIAQRAISLLGGIAVPLMLLSLGYSLAKLEMASIRMSLLLSLMRLFGGFAIGWFCAWLFGLDGVARGVLVAQASMPAAVLNYLFAARYHNKPEEVAGVVVLSTGLSVLTTPLFLWSVMPTT